MSNQNQSLLIVALFIVTTMSILLASSYLYQHETQVDWMQAEDNFEGEVKEFKVYDKRENVIGYMVEQCVDCGAYKFEPIN